MRKLPGRLTTNSRSMSTRIDSSAAKWKIGTNHVKNAKKWVKTFVAAYTGMAVVTVLVILRAPQCDGQPTPKNSVTVNLEATDGLEQAEEAIAMALAEYPDVDWMKFQGLQEGFNISHDTHGTVHIQFDCLTYSSDQKLDEIVKGCADKCSENVCGRIAANIGKAYAGRYSANKDVRPPGFHEMLPRSACAFYRATQQCPQKERNYLSHVALDASARHFFESQYKAGYKRFLFQTADEREVERNAEYVTSWWVGITTLFVGICGLTFAMTIRWVSLITNFWPKPYIFCAFILKFANGGGLLWYKLAGGIEIYTYEEIFLYLCTPIQAPTGELSAALARARAPLPYMMSFVEDVEKVSELEKPFLARSLKLSTTQKKTLNINDDTPLPIILKTCRFKTTHGIYVLVSTIITLLPIYGVLADHKIYPSTIWQICQDTITGRVY